MMCGSQVIMLSTLNYMGLHVNYISIKLEEKFNLQFYKNIKSLYIFFKELFKKNLET